MIDGTGEPPPRNSRAIWWVRTAFGVILVAVLAMAALAVCAVKFKWVGFWPNAGQPFATVIGGMAALAAGALALYNGERQRATEAEHRQVEAQQWREEQKHEAAKDLRARFTTTTTQLADVKPTIRRSGTYAMAALADDWHAFGNDTERQVCIDVLTGYLTTPNPTYTEPTDATPQTAGDDGFVRPTIIRLLATHGAALDQATSWKNADYAVTQADLRALSLREMILQGAQMPRVVLTDANLRGAILNGADLSHADLHGAKLYGAKLDRVDLRDADLRVADLSGADLSGADLSDAEQIDARYDESTILPEGFEPALSDNSPTE